MFNSDLKEEALRDMKRAQKTYQNMYGKAAQSAVLLYNAKRSAEGRLGEAEELINSIARTPKQLRRDIQQVALLRKQFSDEVMALEKETSADVAVTGGVAAAAGATVGIAGPSLMMAAATTFGTASTGTAIASLSGAAASRAALAWLGGGAIAAGGGGMAAGSAFMALAGPVGWGLTAISAGVTIWKLSAKNKAIAEKAEEQTREMKEATYRLRRTNRKVAALREEIVKLDDLMEDLLEEAEPCRNGIFEKSWHLQIGWQKRHVLTGAERQILWNVVNIAQALSVKVNEKVVMDEA